MVNPGPHLVETDGHLRNVLLCVFAATGGVAVAIVNFLVMDLPEYVDSLTGIAILWIAAIVARRLLRRARPTNRLRRALLMCRGMPLRYQSVGALGVLALFLVFDRFLDGDPGHYRLFSFMAPVMVSTVLFNLKPGMFAVATSTIAFNVYFLTLGNLPFTGMINTWSDTAGFCVVCTFMAIGLHVLIDGRRKPCAPSMQIDGLRPPRGRSRLLPHVEHGNSARTVAPRSVAPVGDP
jgi:hypothetical protein